MLDHSKPIPVTQRHVPWNKGRLTGARVIIWRVVLLLVSPRHSAIAHLASRLAVLTQ